MTTAPTEAGKAHTPGPWRVGSSSRAASIQVLTGHKAIAAVWARGDSGLRVTPESWRIAQANARLIAAAPDLLEALRGVLRVADRKTDEFDAARAAIARAEGRAP